MQDLDGADTALDQAAGEESARGEGAGFGNFRTVEFERLLRFLRNVGQLRHAGLHAERHFVLGDAGLRFGIVQLFELFLVQFAERVEHGAAAGGGDAGRILNVENGIADVTEGDSGVFAGEEAAGPHAGEEGLSCGAAAPGRREDDEGREVVAFAAEAIGEPGAEAGFAGHFAAGHHKGARRVVVDGIGVDRLHESQIVDIVGGIRQ
jgi:hypothetical protein